MAFTQDVCLWSLLIAGFATSAATQTDRQTLAQNIAMFSATEMGVWFAEPAADRTSTPPLVIRDEMTVEDCIVTILQREISTNGAERRQFSMRFDLGAVDAPIEVETTRSTDGSRQFVRLTLPFVSGYQASAQRSTLGFETSTPMNEAQFQMTLDADATTHLALIEALNRYQSRYCDPLG